MEGKELFKNLKFKSHIEPRWGHKGAIVYDNKQEEDIETEVIFYIDSDNIAISQKDIANPLEDDESLIFISRDLLKAINQQLEDMK